MIDQSKLFAAEEWTEITTDSWNSARSESYWAMGPERETEEEATMDAAFFALARQAFDVMMRRGWTARRVSLDRWAVTNSITELIAQPHIKAGKLDWFEADDPFTALVEADAWYKLTVEKEKP